ncbi:hypothetical protein WJX73_007248 [Symbiochloris irregularis]|uniref:Uncharacterized protein n=1 Tax=Symbiochloris irregularis TaxID=706552 RepID=A0AAW1NZG4_9CHLO
MTLTSDGSVRIWIEVVLSPTFGPDVSALHSRSPHGSPRGSPKKKSAAASPQNPGPASSAPATGPSQANLCVGLVVQPPEVQRALQSPAGLRGAPAPSAPAARRLPRAMLWGHHHGDLGWPGSAGSDMCQVACSVTSHQGDAPVLQVVESRGPEWRTLRLETVEDDATMPEAHLVHQPSSGQPLVWKIAVRTSQHYCPGADYL